MVEQEVHDTLQEISISEQLTFELEITESAYKSDQDLEGELEVYAKPNDDVIYNRESPPKNVVARFFDRTSQETAGFPGEKAILALSADPVTDSNPEALGLESIEEETTIMNVDWDVEEAERLLAADERKVVYSDNYQLDRFASEDRPFVVEGMLFPDAHEALERNDYLRRLLEGHKRDLESFKGLALLSVSIEHKASGLEPIDVESFHMEVSQTFPEINFLPEDDATYLPEEKRFEWRDRPLEPGRKITYVLHGPVDQLLDIGDVSATLRGSISGSTLARVQVEGVFDGTGSDFPRFPLVNKEVAIQCSIQMDPDALRGKVQSTTDGQINVPLPPEDTYDQMVNLCEREAFDIEWSTPPSGKKTITGQEGVFTYLESGELEIKREYGYEGTVYGYITINGRFTAVSETSEVSAFDQERDRIIREDQGALERRGQSQVDISAVSTSSELNTRLINSLEQGFKGGDQPALSGGP